MPTEAVSLFLIIMAKDVRMRMSNCVIVLFLTIGTAYPQINNIYGSGNEVLRVSKYAEVIGSPYLYLEWREGTIEDQTGKETVGIQLRYDTYSDRFEGRIKGVEMLLDPHLITKVTILEYFGLPRRVFCNRFIGITGATAESYYEVLLDTGSIKFLKKTKTTMIEEDAGYGSSGRVTRFSSAEKYYLITDNRAPSGVKLTKKSFVKEGGMKASLLEVYLKKGKQLKSESDFINFLKLCSIDSR